MRLRFRADAKDVLIFCMFAVLWLIIVALAVLVLLVIFWSIRQLNVNSTTTNMISYVDSNK